MLLEQLGREGEAGPSRPQPSARPSLTPQTAVYRVTAAAADRDFRRAVNRWHAAADLSVQAAAGALFAVVGTRLLLDGQPARAVLAFVCAALATAATWAITYHNKSWHRHRELLLFVLAAIHYTTYVGLVAGSRLPLLNFTAHHQNSRFRLFVQMAYANSALWQLGTVLLCRVVFRRLVPMQLTLAFFVLPLSGQLCASTLRNPGAAEVIARLHHWATRLIAFVNPLAPLGSSFGGQSSAQDMCCAVNTFSLAVLAIIAPLYFSYHSERQARQVFLRTWRPRAEPPGGGSGSSSSTPSRSRSRSRSMSSSMSGTSGSEDELAAAGGATPAALVLGRRRHQRLVQRLEELQCDPTMAAQHEQEAVTELLRHRRPRPVHRVLAEMLLVMLLAWPLSCLLVEVASGWMCAVGS